MPLSSFHPAIQRWFVERLGAPSAPQREGWPLIRAGRHVLIAAPTGSGKTLAAFLSAVDTLLDPNAGWKGRALWSTYGTRTMYHLEGGKANWPKAVKIQLRPDPLAR